MDRLREIVAGINRCEAQRSDQIVRVLQAGVSIPEVMEVTGLGRSRAYELRQVAKQRKKGAINREKELEKLTKTMEELASLDQARDPAIFEAFCAGHSARDIAGVTGVTKGRIYQILKQVEA